MKLNREPFFSTFQSAKRRGRWVVFKNDIPLILKDRLYVRACYDLLLGHFSRKTDVRKYITVSGTPGIGKSVCAHFLLWALVQRGYRVLLLIPGRRIYVDENQNFYDFQFPLPDDIWSNDLWCIVDSKDPTKIDGLRFDLCSIVLFTIPGDDTSSAFLKLIPIPLVFYMPPWILEECGTVACLHPQSEHWRKRYEVLGGNPRLVFVDTREDPVKILVKACAQCSLDDCVRMIGLEFIYDSKTQLVQKLIHVHSEPPHTKCSVGYASETAVKVIVQSKGIEACRRMESLLHSSSENPLAASLCKYIFEPYAVRQLEKGGTFVCRDLVSGLAKSKPQEYNLTVSCAGRKIVDKVTEQDKTGLLHVPTTKSYTQLDSWIPHVGAFQMTVGKTHNLTAAIKPDLDIIVGKLFWVLPPLYFDSFTKKTPMSLQQSALKIPYPNFMEFEEAETASRTHGVGAGKTKRQKTSPN